MSHFLLNCITGAFWDCSLHEKSYIQWHKVEQILPDSTRLDPCRWLAVTDI